MSLCQWNNIKSKSAKVNRKLQAADAISACRACYRYARTGLFKLSITNGILLRIKVQKQKVNCTSYRYLPTVLPIFSLSNGIFSLHHIPQHNSNIVQHLPTNNWLILEQLTYTSNNQTQNAELFFCIMNFKGSDWVWSILMNTHKWCSIVVVTSNEWMKMWMDLGHFQTGLDDCSWRWPWTTILSGTGKKASKHDKRIGEVGTWLAT